jgi:hypothetical protein
MAKTSSIIKIRGSLGGMTFYEQDGVELVRETGGVDKERIMKDPAYKRTRENMKEFGGAAKIGKEFRIIFSEVIKTMGESLIAGRITGLMKKVNSLSSGERGKRSFEFSLYSDQLKGLEFNRKDPFGTVFFAPSDPIVFNADRDVFTWNIPVFNTDSFITPPEGSTHFKVIMVGGSLSDYHYDPDSDDFEPAQPDHNGLSVYSESAVLPLGGVTAAAINLIGDLGVGAALPPDVIVPVAVGIMFYQEINSQFYELASGNAMQIIEIG